MAPSRITKQRSNLRAFGKVSKTASAAASVYLKLNQKPAEKNIDLPLVQIKNEEQLRPSQQSKRKREADDDGNERLDDERTTAKPLPTKKLRASTELPEQLQELRDIHKHFLTAFSIHLAHNGAAAPAGLDTLLQSITRLWKKRTLVPQDLQRILAVYEIDEINKSRQEVVHDQSPFKLVISGIGSYARKTVEYVKSTSFDEKQESCNFESALRHLPTTNYATTDIPFLAFTTGTQTHVRQQKATALRSHILNKIPQAAPDVSALSIADESASTPPIPASTKSRTLSLFDRVKAKQSLLSSTASPTSQQVLAKHAMGRVAEVVEILRMKQQQSPSGRNGGKVSFGMKQIVYEVKGSMTVPIGDDEVRLCLDMLSRDVPGGWVKMWEMGDVKGIVLEGRGLCGQEVRKILEEKS